MRGGGGQKNQFVFKNCFRYSGRSPGNLVIFILEYPGKVLEFSFPSSVETMQLWQCICVAKFIFSYWWDVGKNVTTWCCQMWRKLRCWSLNKTCIYDENIPGVECIWNNLDSGSTGLVNNLKQKRVKSCFVIPAQMPWKNMFLLLDHWVERGSTIEWM